MECKSVVRKSTIPLKARDFKGTIDVALYREETQTGSRTIDLEPAPRIITTLSITMSSKKYYGGRWEDYVYGQGIDVIANEYAEHVKESGNTSEYKFLMRLVELWRRWHLNHLHAGTRLQMDALKELPRNVKDYFSSAQALLREKGLEPDRGYNYGEEWLVEILPKEIIAELGQLCRQLGAQDDQRKTC